MPREASEPRLFFAGCRKPAAFELPILAHGKDFVKAPRAFATAIVDAPTAVRAAQFRSRGPPPRAPICRSAAIFRQTRNGVHPISGARNRATPFVFGDPRSSRCALHAVPRIPAMTRRHVAWPGFSSPPALPRRTPTRHSALWLRGGRRTPLIAYALSLPVLLRRGNKMGAALIKNLVKYCFKIEFIRVRQAASRTVKPRGLAFTPMSERSRFPAAPYLATGHLPLATCFTARQRTTYRSGITPAESNTS